MRKKKGHVNNKRSPVNKMSFSMALNTGGKRRTRPSPGSGARFVRSTGKVNTSPSRRSGMNQKGKRVF